MQFIEYGVARCLTRNNTFYRLAATALIAACLLMVTTTSADTFTNPIVEQRADPWVYKHSDGFYYFTASVPITTALFCASRQPWLEFQARTRSPPGLSPAAAR